MDLFARSMLWSIVCCSAVHISQEKKHTQVFQKKKNAKGKRHFDRFLYTNGTVGVIGEVSSVR